MAESSNMSDELLSPQEWEKRLSVVGPEADDWALLFKKCGFHPVLPRLDALVRERVRGMLILRVTGHSTSAVVPAEVEPTLERYTDWVINRLGSSNFCLPAHLRREKALNQIVNETSDPDFLRGLGPRVMTRSRLRIRLARWLLGDVNPHPAEE